MVNTVFKPMVRVHRSPNHLHSNGVSHHHVAVNILEKQDRFIIELAVPGFEKEEITITLDQNRLVVKGQKKEQTSDNYLRKEWKMSTFEKSFNLGENVAGDKSEALTQNGVLSIIVPKVEKQAPVSVKVI